MQLKYVPWLQDDTYGTYANVELPNGMWLQMWWTNDNRIQCYVDESEVPPDHTSKSAIKVWLNTTPLEAQCLLHQLLTNPDEVIDGTKG